MYRDIEAVFFDMGDTLGIRVADPAAQSHARSQLTALLGTEEPAETLLLRLDERYKVYVRWRQETLIEVSEEELWNRWLLPDSRAPRTRAMAEELTLLWRSCYGRRVLRDDAPSVIAQLRDRGYRLGIVSNTISARETPGCLKEYGLSDCFSTIILSCVSRRRKPDPELFWQATRQSGVRPERSAYLGDRPSRDVIGPRRAKFAMTILYGGSSHGEQADDPVLRPDAIIHTLGELLNLFPARQLSS